MLKYIILIMVLLPSCVSTSTYKVQSPIVVSDPDPLCRFRKEPTNLELLDRILNHSMVDTNVKVPYKAKSPVLLKVDSFKVCSLKEETKEPCFFYDVFCE